jgi:3D (Asp-Asp-Asp) domain-containing protein
MPTPILGLAALLLMEFFAPVRAPWCGQTRISGYVRTDFSGFTYDGTPITTPERIVAASWDVRMGSLADIQGLGTFRVADRGHLGNGVPMPWVDVAVWTRAEAYALTGIRRVCFRRPIR